MVNGENYLLGMRVITNDVLLLLTSAGISETGPHLLHGRFGKEGDWFYLKLAPSGSADYTRLIP